jgi:hypothetical protein
MENRQIADFRAQMTGVSPNLLQGLADRMKEDVVDHPLVLKCNGRYRGWHGENDMEVFHRQKLRLALL